MTRAEWRRDSFFVANAWHRADDVVEVENPATGTTVGTAANACTAAVDAAVSAARDAFTFWGATTPAQRAAQLAALHRALTVRRNLLVETTVAEVGAPVRVAREAHVDLALDIVGHYVDLLAGLGDGPADRIGNSLVFREPVGVAGCITPWNYPVYQLLIKLAPALAAGCTVIAKPAELTPLSAYLVADAAVEAGLPAGVLNLVPGSGATVGEAIVAHPGVDLVSFTGSTSVGARVAAGAAATLKRVTLELGGKSASVVLPDADLACAVRATVDSATLNSGQTCSAWTRLIVPTDQYESAYTLACEHAAELVIGDPTRERTDLGPLISAKQKQAVTALVERAVADGARGYSPGYKPEPAGHFFAPVVLADLAPDSEIAQEEVFGPVLVLLPYRDEEEALELANNSLYGLAGAVWSANPARAVAFARRMRTGQVDINGAAFNLAAPFGGYKRSGYGRELGRFGYEEFTEVKAVQL
ncbi:MAG TPA: aldehyde dehydrogenase family protein [Micromonosporaceae bacterium]|nr:aldehyde dehydrogenase family protein [Micromonosporaceae bacterium]